MKLATYNTADQFLKVTRDWLVRDEAANNLMLGIALRLGRSAVPCYLATVNNGKEVVLAALLTPPFPITLNSPTEAPDEALEALIRYLIEAGAPIPSVSGPPELAERFAALWAAHKKVQCRIQMRMRVYQLQEVTPPPVRPGHFRIASTADLPLLTTWMRGFLDESLHGENSDAAGETTRRRVGDGELFVWDVEGQPVSMAASTRPLVRGVSVNMVYTPPELRARGYASVCVAALSRHLLNEGWAFCTLFTDLDNPTSNSIYQKIGYRPVRDFAQYEFC
jgi:predicted GNAT family acetyltransferase